MIRWKSNDVRLGQMPDGALVRSRLGTVYLIIGHVPGLRDQITLEVVELGRQVPAQWRIGHRLTTGGNWTPPLVSCGGLVVSV